MIIRPSPFGFDETVQRLTDEIAAHGATLFGIIDHAEHADRAGLPMPPTSVAIFGNPSIGTPAMLASPDLALDLPSRVLVRVGSAGVVEVVYRDPAEITEPFDVPDDLAAQFTGLIRIVDDALNGR